MNPLTEQFIEYLDTDKPFADMKIKFAERFACRLFAEAWRYRINEGHSTLFLDTARSLVNETIDEFCTAREIYRYSLRQYHIDELISEIAAYAVSNLRLKKLVNHWLREDRETLFRESFFTEPLEFISYEEPVINTFVYWLDYIDQMQVQGMKEYKDWFELKRKLIALLRITRATFQPGEAGYQATILSKADSQ